MIRTWALLRWCSTKRRYIKCTYLYLLHDHIKDLGVIVNSNLTPSSHIASITVTANQRVRLIYRSFISRDFHLLIRPFTTYVRPILEFNSDIWSPYYKGEIECIEKVQRRFTKWLPGFRNLTYGQRLKRVSLPNLGLRRLHADLVMCYKMVSGLVKLSFAERTPVQIVC